MYTILIYGTGSYVLGNNNIKPVILPAVMNFLKEHGIKAEIIFIKKKIIIFKI